MEIWYPLYDGLEITAGDAATGEPRTAGRHLVPRHFNRQAFIHVDGAFDPQRRARLYFTRFQSLHTCILRDFSRCRPVFFAMRERARA